MLSFGRQVRVVSERRACLPSLYNLCTNVALREKRDASQGFLKDGYNRRGLIGLNTNHDRVEIKHGMPQR